MKKQYTVFSVNTQPTTVEAVLPGGAKVNAVVDSVEIQLVPKDSNSGTLKLSYTDPADIEAARATFVPDSTVEVDFSQATAVA